MVETALTKGGKGSSAQGKSNQGLTCFLNIKLEAQEGNGAMNRCLVTKGTMVRNLDSFPIGKEEAL